MKKVLISVFDKTNLVSFAQFLIAQGYEIISTGGTYKYLLENKIQATEINQVTNFPEMLDGRVKTLHPYLHGGILAKRNNPKHMETLATHNIAPIAMVVVNLYPFFEKMNTGLSEAEMIEFIDIGGPTMLRSAAKSFEDVTVISTTDDYELIMQEIKNQGDTTRETRKKLAGKVFNLTSAYDAAIAQYILQEDFPQFLNTSYEKVTDLRYGENPHQQAAFYVDKTKHGAMKNFVQLQGKELSFNNIRDMDMAYKVVHEFKEIACCAVKHSTPCGVAIGDTVMNTYQKAYDCDPTSIFGGIVAFNATVDASTAERLKEIFLEVIIAPAFTSEALEILATKKNLRVIQIKNSTADTIELVKVDGGLLAQHTDNQFATEFNSVTTQHPTEEQLQDLIFAQKIVKHAKSNAIVVAKNGQALGIGSGQTNRIWATEQAIERAKAKQDSGLVLASDAFFPFRDVVDACASNGIEAIIQPGGSMRDNESIQACEEHQIPMLFTGLRHFKH